jgi:hypothetical protein
MFIELTDHLRCPEPHEEAFLVLLPSRMEARRVVAGHLGCPFCGWNTDWDDGIPDFGGGRRLEGEPAFDAEQLHAMLGIEGPGGWVALGGRAGLMAAELSELLPNVGIVAINPPPEVASSGGVSVLTSGVWPIKRHALRGAVVGLDASEWFAAALDSVLPSRHLIGEGVALDAPRAKLLATAGGVWVVRSA